MATLTIRNVPDELVERIKEVASAQGRSMEQEVRELLASRYADRQQVMSRVRERWATLPATSAARVKQWRASGRR
jgi:plasmid stability protein